MTILDGKVDTIEMYPMIPVPTHVGVTVFAKEVYQYFEAFFDMSVKTDFEKVLFPILAERGELGAVPVHDEAWLPVNDPKSWQQLENLMQNE